MMRIGFFLLTARFDDEKRGHYMICSLTSADLNVCIFGRVREYPLKMARKFRFSHGLSWLI